MSWVRWGWYNESNDLKCQEQGASWRWRQRFVPTTHSTRRHIPKCSQSFEPPRSHTGTSISMRTVYTYECEHYLRQWPTWYTTSLLYVYYNRLHVSSIICSSSGGWIVLMQHLVSSVSVSGRPVHWTATYGEWRYQMLHQYNSTSWRWAYNARNM